MNDIKTYIQNLGRGARTAIFALAVVFISAGVAQAATTISTNIFTGGTLGALGVSTFGATASTTISTAGVLTAPSAIINGTLASLGVSTFGSTASTTISVAGVLTTPSSAVALFLGGASTTQLTLLSGDTIKNTVASTTVISGNLTTSTTTITGLTATGNTTLASTTATTMKVGQVGTSMTRIVSGYCVTGSITIPATNASSTQAYADCTPSGGASVITSGDRVFLQATSSLPYYVVIQAASSTAGGLINISLTNFSTSTSPTANVYAFSFWAFQ